MPPRRRLLFGLLLASALLAWRARVLWIASGARFTRANFAQVKKGMPREEVIRIVGGPPNDYATAEHYVAGGIARLVRYDKWRCDDAVLLVQFDDADTADDVILKEGAADVVVCPPPPTLVERILRWLGL
jgi:hypothetical protein